MLSQLMRSLSPHAFSSFVLKNGLIVISCGSAAGAMFRDLIAGIVEDLIVPTVYMATHRVSPERAEVAFRNVKTRIDAVSLFQGVFKFTMGMMALYFVATLVLTNVLATLSSAKAKPGRV